MHDCKNRPTCFPPFNAIDVRDFDVEQSADSPVFSGTKDDVNDLRDMQVEPVEMEISGESVRIVDDVRWADAHVKRIAEVCADEGAKRKSVCGKQPVQSLYCDTLSSQRLRVNLALAKKDSNLFGHENSV